MTKDIVDELAERAADQLSEHADSVIIFVTLPGNVTLAVGRGNGSAQIGQIKDWVIEQDEITRYKAQLRAETAGELADELGEGSED